jgi:hypothetical protein
VSTSGRTLFRGRGPTGPRLYTILGRAFWAYLPGAALALRGATGDATMTTPGGVGTLRYEALLQLHPCSTHRLLSWGPSYAPTWLRPFALPTLMPQGFPYVH